MEMGCYDAGRMPSAERKLSWSFLPLPFSASLRLCVTPLLFVVVPSLLPTENFRYRTPLLRKTTMKLAVYSLVTPDYDIEGAAALIADVGYTGIEWTLDYPNAVSDDDSNWHIDTDNLEDTVGRVRAASAANGLEIVGVCPRLDCFETDAVLKYLAVAGQVGATGMRVHGPGYNGKTHVNELLERGNQAYAALIPAAREAGVKLWVELHCGRVCASAAATAFRLLDGLDTDWVGVIHDPGNMIIEGFENWQMGLEMLGDLLHHVHVKNSFAKRNDDGTWGREESSLAAGQVDWPEFIATLKTVGYDGYLSIEDFRGGYACKPEGITTREKLQEDFDFLTALI